MLMRRLIFISVSVLLFMALFSLTSCQPGAQPQQPQPQPEETVYKNIEKVKNDLLVSSEDTETTVNLKGYVVYRFEDSSLILANDKTAIMFKNSGLSSKYVGKEIQLKSVKAVYKNKAFYLERTSSTEIFVDLSGKTPPQAKNLNASGELPAPSLKEAFALMNGLYSTVRGTIRFDSDSNKYFVTYSIGTKNQVFEISDEYSISLINQFNVDKPITVDAEATLTGYLFYETNSWKFRVSNAEIEIPAPDVNVGINIPEYVPPVEQATVTYYQAEKKLLVEYTYTLPDVVFMIYKEYNNPSNENEKVYELIGETTSTTFEKTEFDLEEISGIGVRVLSADKTKESELFIISRDKFIVK
ncbi:hypothetical protein Ferpe_1996 [Fervidobacterium pennivorans DSM 9078]|uniref:Uncharacterized protein n=1 Tax=Fervidobacterium pennivorans (strain DSM 9078 / Ven5) TaxID=771875 RepID=H9UEV1_FERPD|nr:hypothetical protein [Fervidobacterium pennivorans]AFG36044.1 hypothetical protein Ferpe_1996 [Fervidobacterium pennivorans DSM 9078]